MKISRQFFLLAAATFLASFGVVQLADSSPQGVWLAVISGILLTSSVVSVCVGFFFHVEGE